jgi:outer membrane receptor protein involved in Fe transport
VRVDDIYEASYGVFAESTVKWTPWFRTVAGARADAFYFDVTSDNALNSGDEWDGIISPKFSAIFGPWKETELYVNLGTGFHSNDARGVNNTVDPTSGDPLDAVDPLVRTVGGEIGIRSQVVANLTSTLSLWWLDSDSELVYVGDAGLNEPGPASRRFGVEWTNYWRPNDWLSIDGEIALTHARFRGEGSADRIPNSIPIMFSGGVALGREEGYFASLRARAFVSRPLEETGTIEGKDTLTVNAQVGYRTKDWEFALQCLNLLDRNDNDIEYYYASQLSSEISSVEDTHFHPAEPRMIRARITYRF